MPISTASRTGACVCATGDDTDSDADPDSSKLTADDEDAAAGAEIVFAGAAGLSSLPDIKVKSKVPEHARATTATNDTVP